MSSSVRNRHCGCGALPVNPSAMHPGRQPSGRRCATGQPQRVALEVGVRHGLGLRARPEDVPRSLRGLTVARRECPAPRDPRGAGPPAGAPRVQFGVVRPEQALRLGLPAHEPVPGEGREPGHRHPRGAFPGSLPSSAKAVLPSPSGSCGTHLPVVAGHRNPDGARTRNPRAATLSHTTSKNSRSMPPASRPSSRAPWASMNPIRSGWRRSTRHDARAVASSNSMPRRTRSSSWPADPSRCAAMSAEKRWKRVPGAARGRRVQEAPHWSTSSPGQPGRSSAGALAGLRPRLSSRVARRSRRRLRGREAAAASGAPKAPLRGRREVLAEAGVHRLQQVHSRGLRDGPGRRWAARLRPGYCRRRWYSGAPAPTRPPGGTATRRMLFAAAIGAPGTAGPFSGPQAP